MNSVINLLTICRKAGKLTMGFDASKDALAAGKVFLIIVASDISPKTEKEIRFFADKAGVYVNKANICIEEFHVGVGKKAAIYSICDDGFAKKLKSLTDNA